MNLFEFLINDYCDNDLQKSISVKLAYRCIILTMMIKYVDICYFLGVSYVFRNHWLKQILRFSNSSNLLFFIYPCR